MSDLLDWCKVTGEWSSEQQHCLISRPPLTTLLSPSPLGLRIAFWLFFAGGILLFRLTFYVCYLCMLLAVVETKSDSAPRRRELVKPADTTYPQIARPREENPLWDLDTDDEEPPLRLRRGLWFRALPLKCATVFRAGILTLWPWFIWDQSDERLATQDLATCLNHLRYMAGDSWWPLRAVGSYFTYWVLNRRFYAVGLALILWLVIIMIQMGHDIFTTPWGSSGTQTWVPTWPFAFIAAVVTGLDPHNGFAFHTLRVITRATGIETNFVTLNFYDPKIINRSPLGAITLAATAWWAMMYCTGLYITNLVPWLLVRHLGLDDTEYVISSDPERGVNLILAHEASKRALILAYLLWFTLRFLILTPTFVFMVFEQAQLLPNGEAAIVGFVHAGQWRKLSVSKKVALVYHRVGWRRVLRLGVQIGMAISVVATFFILSAWFTLSRMPNIDLIVDWVVREYLDFGLGVTIPGMFKNSLFWAYWKKIWVDEADWSWVLGSTDIVPII